METLQKELRVAETIFSTNLTNLNLERSDIFASYPSLQMLTKPSLPEYPSSPNPKLTFLGMAFCSLLATTGLIYSRYSRNIKYSSIDTNENILNLNGSQFNTHSRLNSKVENTENSLIVQLTEKSSNKPSSEKANDKNSDVNKHNNQN